MKSLPLILFLGTVFQACISRQKPHANLYEVKSRDSANFTLVCKALFPKEILTVFVNKTMLYKIVGNKAMKDNNYRVYFRYPGTIKTVRVVSKFLGRRMYEMTLIDTFRVPRISLFISPPYPKSIKNLPMDPAWQPELGGNIN